MQRSHASLLCHTEDGYSMIDLLPNNPIKDGTAFRVSCDTLEALGAVFVKYAFHKTSGRPSSAASFQAVVLSKDGGGMSISCPYPSSMLIICTHSYILSMACSCHLNIQERICPLAIFEISCGPLSLHHPLVLQWILIPSDLYLSLAMLTRILLGYSRM